MKLVYTVEIDEAKLDEMARSLYDGEEHGDPVQGEPRPGLHVLEGFAAEARHDIAQGNSVDTLFWEDEYMTSITVEIHEETGEADAQAT